MPSTINQCPRCHAEVLPAMARCRECGQMMSRTTKIESAEASSVAATVPVAVSMQVDQDTATMVLDRGTDPATSVAKIRVTCGCGVTIRASQTLMGKRIKCPKCSAAVLVSELPEQRTERTPKPDQSGTFPRSPLTAKKQRKLLNQLEVTNPLSEAEAVLRRQALLELGNSQDGSLLPVLIEHTQDMSVIVRDGAVTALGDLGDSQAVPTLLEALLDRESDIIRSAFTALKKVGDRRVVLPLLRLGTERPQWKPLAIDTLVRLGSVLVEELLGILQKASDVALTLDAIVVLGRIGDKQAVPMLIASLDHLPDLLKAHATESLALIGDLRAVSPLLRMLQEPNVGVRVNAAAGLSRLIDPRSFRPLVNALQDEDSDVRRYAAIALGELGELKAVPELLKILQAWQHLNDLDAAFLEAVIESVGKLGDVSAVPDLLPILQSRHDGVCLKTVLALKKLRDPSAAPALASLLHSPQATLRRRVVETLGQMGADSLVPT
ncbi:MAG: HEAT repeat domain-containing protein, partial [Planctomycetaceae bacterium]|nr:HEAT repeat domain-containing protein [Planctomycetaceae bacterium]